MNNEQALHLIRLKNASEAYKELRAIYTDPVTEEVDPSFVSWPEFRDKFIEDWKSNRIVVDEKEADAIFDRIVDEAEEELERGVLEHRSPVVEAKAIWPPNVTESTSGEVIEVKKSKAEIGREVFKLMNNKPRKEVIQALINLAGMTPAGASTYYQRFKTESGTSNEIVSKHGAN
jgi:hypothetical protein